jgi:uncharacterized membrane protein YGL010W
VTTLKQQLRSYGEYHRDTRNKLTHVIGVPLVTFSLFLVLGWFRFVHAPDLPITGATVFYLFVTIYYLRLDWMVALVQAPFSLALLWLADRAAVLPVGPSIVVFLATFFVGAAVQLLGHAIEGRRPALADNILQIFNAPLFLAAELLLMLGLRRDLRERLVVTGTSDA